MPSVAVININSFLKFCRAPVETWIGLILTWHTFENWTRLWVFLSAVLRLHFCQPVGGQKTQQCYSCSSIDLAAFRSVLYLSAIRPPTEQSTVVRGWERSHPFMQMAFEGLLLFNLSNSEIFTLNNTRLRLINRWKVPFLSFRLPANNLLDNNVKCYWSIFLIFPEELSLFTEKVWETEKETFRGKCNFCMPSHLCTWDKLQRWVLWLLEGVSEALRWSNMHFIWNILGH